MDAWVSLVAGESQFLGYALLDWAQIAGFRPAPGRVVAATAPGAEPEQWLRTVWRLIDLGAAGEIEQLRAQVAPIAKREPGEQLQIAYALAVRAKEIAEVCGGFERLRDLTTLVARARPAEVFEETTPAVGAAVLMIGAISVGNEHAAKQAHCELLTYHPERLGALNIVIAATAAQMGRAAFLMARDENGIPTALQDLRTPSQESQGLDGVVAGIGRDLVDGIRERDGVKLASSIERMEMLEPEARLVLGWQLAWGAGTFIGQKLASAQSSA